MTNQFDSKGGPQNVGQGEHPIGQQNNYGVPYEAYGALAGKLAVTESALTSFFRILEQQQVPLSDLDSKLREIAFHYKELLLRSEAITYSPQVYNLEGKPIGALHVGCYSDALPLYEQSLAISRGIGDKAGEARALNNISQMYHDRGGYATALALKYLKQSLAIMREIGDKAGEGVTLSNISQMYHDRGDYATALKYYKQSLTICRELGDKAGESTTLNNISQIYKARGDYPTALKYLEQSLRIRQEIGDRHREAVTSWNIGRVYEDKGDLSKAEQYISRAVQLAEEIGHSKLKEWRKALAALRAKLRGK